MILDLLKERKYGELDALFSGYQTSYEDGKVSDETVKRAYVSFANSDPTLKPKLNEWTEHSPKACSAFLARGVYLRNLGFLAKPDGSTTEISKQDKEEMNRYLSAAMEDFRQALTLQPRVIPAYGELMAISRYLRRDDITRDLLNEALAVDPQSWSVRVEYLVSLQPRWGGSLEDMIAFIEETKPHYEADPKLRILEGYLLYTLGEAMVLEKNDRAGAVGYFNDAVTHGEYWFYYYARGHNYYSFDAYDHAIADLTRALKLYPYSVSALKYRGYSYYHNENYENARKDFDRAIGLDALDPDLLQGRGRVLFHQGKFQEAFQDYEKALTFGGKRPGVWAEMGNLQLYQLKDYPGAVKSFGTAIDLNFLSYRSWIGYLLANIMSLLGSVFSV